MKIVTSKFFIFLCFYVIAMMCLWAVDSLYFDIYSRYEHGKVLFISLGAAFGIALTMFVSFLITEKIRKRNRLQILSVPVITAYSLAILALPFAFMAGVVAGGTMGGGLLESLFRWLNLNTKVGISIGIGLGIFFISLLVILPVLFSGYYLGKGMKKLAR